MVEAGPKLKVQEMLVLNTNGLVSGCIGVGFGRRVCVADFVLVCNASRVVCDRKTLPLGREKMTYCSVLCTCSLPWPLRPS